MTSAEIRTSEARRREVDWGKLIQTALDTPGSVGNVYNRFYDYSFMNQMFLRMQGVTEPVATYKRWQALGRQVVRGSQAHGIVRPIIAKRAEDEGAETRRLLGFKVVNCLFAVSQTEGAELSPVDIPDWDLDVALAKLDVRRTDFRLADGNTQGYSTGREFAVNPVAVDPVRTTFHELGHIVLGHTAQRSDQASASAVRREREFQAEATAYLTLNELEQLTPELVIHSYGYIQHWLRDDRPSNNAIRQVFTATDTILKAGRPSIDVSGTPDV